MRARSIGKGSTGRAAFVGCLMVACLTVARHPRFRLAGMVLSGVVAVIAVQGLCVSQIMTKLQRRRVLFADVVVVYGGGLARVPAGFRVAHEVGARWLVFSGSEEEIRFEKGRLEYRMPRSWSIRVVGGAYTTDQNARTVVPVLKELRIRSAVLVTSWYHMPRAYFLTRLYLLGSGITLDCGPAESVPAGWWRRAELVRELPRFWGSLFRAGAALVGIDNWPRPAGMPRRT